MEAGEDFDQAPKAPKPVSNQINGTVHGRTVGNIDNFWLIRKIHILYKFGPKKLIF